ncbi:hypothetical protein A4F85_02075 [Delftia sp. GW456-R20]|nr:hypothetical protein A4F85_02075 [Delftia sp. GW456-R20]
MHSPRKSKRSGPLPHQKRLYRSRQERLMEAWHKASLNLHAAMRKTMAALQLPAAELGHV